MKLATVRARARLSGPDYNYERGDVFKCPLSTAVRFGVSVEILSTEDEPDPTPPIPPRGGTRVMEDYPNRMQKRARTRDDAPPLPE